jgi:hypothetical protein
MSGIAPSFSPRHTLAEGGSTCVNICDALCLGWAPKTVE